MNINTLSFQNQADGVLYELIRSGIDTNVTLTRFNNMREQGFVITQIRKSGPISIAFSENRNSDHIVMYVSDKDLSLIENFMNHDDMSFWDSARFFNPHQFKQAATFIESLLE